MASTDADTPPLFFTKVLGSLRPANPAAHDALKAITGTVKVKITKATANQRRRGMYWLTLAVAAEVLADKTGDPWDAELLHKELKIVLKLGETFTTPSGREVFKPASTADAKMSEPERARWTDRTMAVLSTWCGVPVADLLTEARVRDAQ